MSDNKEFKELITKLFEKRDEIEKQEESLSGLNRELKEIESKIINIMEALDMTSFDLNDRKLSRVSKKSFKQPEDKAAFFDYLKREGSFEALVSVNSQTLNAWLKGKIKDAEDRGEFFDLPPGITEPTPYTILQVRKK